MFPLLCLVTFGVFSSYWLTTALCKKTITAIKKSSLRSTPSQSTPSQPSSYRITVAEPESVKLIEPQSKLTSASTQHEPNPSHMKSENNGNILKVQAPCPGLEDHSNTSVNNELNVAMIEGGDSSYQLDGHGEGKAEAKGQILDQVMQSEYRLEDLGHGEEGEGRDKKEGSLLNIQQQQWRRQQHSELQIIQALSTDKLPHIECPAIGPCTTEPQCLPAPRKPSSQADPTILKLTQQIDQLFLNNHEQFMSIINKYKVQEARYGLDYEENARWQDRQDRMMLGERVDWLERELMDKGEEMGMMEIVVAEYKTAAEGHESEIVELKAKVDKLECLTTTLSQQNKFLQSKLQSQSNSQQIQFKTQTQLEQKSSQIHKLKQELSTTKEKLGKVEQELALQQGKNAKLAEQLGQLEKDFDFNLTVISNLKGEVERVNKELVEARSQDQKGKEGKEEVRINEKEYLEKLQQFEQEIQRIRDEATAEKKKYDQLLALSSLKQPSPQPQKQEYLPISTRQNLTHSNSSSPVLKYSQNEILELQKTNENLKNEIQFAQTQIRMFEQTEASYLKHISQLQQQISSGPSSEILQLRAKISKMQPIVNEYEIMQRRYFEIKIKYEKLVHQRPQLNNSNSNSNSRREEGGSQIVMPTSPKANRYTSAIFVSDSPASNISGNNEKKGSPSVGHYRFLFDCAFISLQDRQFVYQTIRSLLKGVLKTQKLYNSKTNRSKNPHQFIDNIRGILLLIQLQNDKLIGAYTHEAFSPIHPQSSNDNIAFILDIGNRKSFANQSGLNSISYSPGSLVWGFNEILLKHEEPEVMYSNFCRNHNIYWDGKHQIEDFIGCDKQWARIHQYELFRVSKI